MAEPLEEGTVAADVLGALDDVEAGPGRAGRVVAPELDAVDLELVPLLPGVERPGTEGGLQHLEVLVHLLGHQERPPSSGALRTDRAQGEPATGRCTPAKYPPSRGGRQLDAAYLLALDGAAQERCPLPTVQLSHICPCSSDDPGRPTSRVCRSHRPRSGRSAYLCRVSDAIALMYGGRTCGECRLGVQNGPHRCRQSRVNAQRRDGDPDACARLGSDRVLGSRQGHRGSHQAAKTHAHLPSDNAGMTAGVRRQAGSSFAASGSGGGDTTSVLLMPVPGTLTVRATLPSDRRPILKPAYPGRGRDPTL